MKVNVLSPPTADKLIEGCKVKNKTHVILNKVKNPKSNKMSCCPEAQDAGTIILTGFEPETVLSSVRTAIKEYQSKHIGHSEQSEESMSQHTNSIPTDYQITNTFWRVLKLIIGNTKLSNK